MSEMKKEEVEAKVKEVVKNAVGCYSYDLYREGIKDGCAVLLAWLVEKGVIEL